MKLCFLLLLLLASAISIPRSVATHANYVGFFDVGDCNVLAGWAADRNTLISPIKIAIFDGPTRITTVIANVSRPDVGAAIGDNGLHGFNLPTPAALKDGQTHSIAIRFEGTT